MQKVNVKGQLKYLQSDRRSGASIKLSFNLLIQFYLNNVTNLYQLTSHSTTSWPWPTTWKSYRDHRLLWRHFIPCIASIRRSKTCLDCGQRMIIFVEHYDECRPMIGWNDWRCVHGCKWIAETQRWTAHRWDLQQEIHASVFLCGTVGRPLPLLSCWDLQHGAWSSEPCVTLHNSPSSHRNAESANRNTHRAVRCRWVHIYPWRFLLLYKYLIVNCNSIFCYICRVKVNVITWTPYWAYFRLLTYLPRWQHFRCISISCTYYDLMTLKLCHVLGIRYQHRKISPFAKFIKSMHPSVTDIWLQLQLLLTSCVRILCRTIVKLAGSYSDML